MKQILFPKDVKECRRLRRKGALLDQLAKKYGVSKQRIHIICLDVKKKRVEV